MLNLKLKAIASLISKDDVVIDIGTDHAYLAIYLKENNLCKEVYASDINANVLKIAQKNIKNHNLNIPTYLADGFNNIENSNINTAIIAGMGTNTILHIMENVPSNMTKLIISSNNNHYELRKKMLKLHFYIQKETVIQEKGKFYPIMLFSKNYQKETTKTLKYGKSYNKEYLNYLLQKEQEILSKIPKKQIFKYLKHYYELKTIKKILIKRT